MLENFCMRIIFLSLCKGVLVMIFFLKEFMYDPFMSKILSFYFTSKSSLPSDAIPEQDVMIYPHLKPALKIRLLGDKIKEGSIPSTVFRDIGDMAIKSIKSLVDYTTSKHVHPSANRTFEAFRNMYNLPAQRVEYTSLAISFASPAIDLPQLSLLDRDEQDHAQQRQEALDSAWQLLQRGLTWLSCESVASLDDTIADQQEKLAILSCLQALTPPKTGFIERIELSGYSIDPVGKRIVLNREHRSRVNTYLKQTIAYQIREFSGKITELDKARNSLQLRDENNALIGSGTYSFDDALLDDLQDAFVTENTISLLVETKNSKKWDIVRIITSTTVS